MRFDYAHVTQAIRRERETQEPQESLRNEQCASLLFLHPQLSGKVFLLLHGFTAGPYQFATIAQSLFAEGWNVLVPRLPGHGLAGYWSQVSPPPMPLHKRIYQEFALRWLKRSRFLGQQIVVGGVAGGATLAAWLGINYAQQIDRICLLSPYWHQSKAVIQLFTQNHESYYAWVTRQTASPLLGYNGFTLATLKPFLELEAEIFATLSVQRSPPLLLVTSESDRALNQTTNDTFLDAVRQTQPQTWHLKFDNVLDLPYAMMTYTKESDKQSKVYELQIFHLIRHFVKLKLSHR